MTIQALKTQLDQIAQECGDSNIAFLATAVLLDKAQAPQVAITVSQVLADKSGYLPLVALSREAACQLKVKALQNNLTQAVTSPPKADKKAPPVPSGRRK